MVKMSKTVIKQEVSDDFIEIDPSSSLVVKVEVQDEEIFPKQPALYETVVESSSQMLCCPKCHVPYPKLASYRNHVAVCKRDQFK